MSRPSAVGTISPTALPHTNMESRYWSRNAWRPRWPRPTFTVRINRSSPSRALSSRHSTRSPPHSRTSLPMAASTTGTASRTARYSAASPAPRGVEYDKLIDRQMERAAITTISGYAKIFEDASRVLSI